MNVLREYTWDHIKNNKKSSLAIMIAIFIASVLLGSICIAGYTVWLDEIKLIKMRSGNWHGELFDDTKGENLNYVKAHANVETVMVKGNWYVGQIEDEKRPYLIIRDADKEYWASMPEGGSIVEGRIPQKSGEIVVSKQFIARHPEIEIGSQITLPIGNRVNGVEILDPRSSLRNGETFQVSGEESYTIVGVLDIATSSVVPGYAAMGYLEHENILPTDDLTIYMRMKNPRTIHKDLPEIASQVGHTPNEYGEYFVRYNNGLLSKYFIFPPIEGVPPLRYMGQPLSYLTMGILIIGVFVLIINNAFALSTQGRIGQLGMFKSIGATPKQIRSSILFEAMILSVIPIPLGIITSYGLAYLFFEKLDEMQQGMEGYISMELSFGIPVVILAVIMILITVALSAYLPTRKMSKKVPIEILRHSALKERKRKKDRRWKLKRLGIYEELAINGFRAHSKTFRTSLISLTFSFLLLIAFLSIAVSMEMGSDKYFFDKISYTMQLYTADGNPIEQEVVDVIRNHPKIKESRFFSNTPASVWVTEEEESQEIKALGGFEAIAATNEYTLIERDDKFRIRTQLVGLDDESFRKYCDLLGINAQEYYDSEQIKTIVYHEVTDSFNASPKNMIRIPLLDVHPGDYLTVNEKVDDRSEGDYTFQAEVGTITEIEPPVEINQLHYSIFQILPMSMYQKIISNFEADKISRSLRTEVQMYVDEIDIPEVLEAIKQVCEKWYSEGDYSTWDLATVNRSRAVGDQVMKILAYCVSGFFAIIGISNAFTTIYGSLAHRRREFAMLRSIGVSPQGIKRILTLEGIYFAILPMIISIPIVGVIQWIFIEINGLKWSEFFAGISVAPIIIFIVVIWTAIATAYWMGSGQIRKENIVECIKDETI